MAFIHKNVNSALMMLIAFISVSLVTATVYSVNAFDSINSAYAEQAMRADELEKQLAEKAAMTDRLMTAQATAQEREQALAEILQKQREEATQQQAETQPVTVTATSTSKTTGSATRTSTTYRNPYYNRWYWMRN